MVEPLAQRDYVGGQTNRTIDRSSPCMWWSYLYTVYSLGGGDVGSLIFFLPKLPIQRTESFKTTMADIAGSLVLSTLVLKSISTWWEKQNHNNSVQIDKEKKKTSPSLEPLLEV